jgi:hypothetical protein
MRRSLSNHEQKRQIAAKLARIDPIGVAVGILLSLALHGMLVAWAWQRALPAGNRSAAQTQVVLEVRLRPAPAALPTPLPDAQPREAPPTRKAQISRTPKPIALQAATQNDKPAVVNPAAPTPAAPEKHMDVESVRAGLGAIVAEVDREKRDTPVGQLITHPLYPPEADNKMARAVEGSSRSDCRNSIANTGLLAPLVILTMAFDRKNSGCKW